MLELTRRIGESIDVGRATKITLTAMAPGQVQINIEHGNDQRLVDLVTGGVHSQTVDGVRLQVQLLAVIRGIARLGFLAPRSLPIHRSEKVNR